MGMHLSVQVGLEGTRDGLVRRSSCFARFARAGRYGNDPWLTLQSMQEHTV